MPLFVVERNMPEVRGLSDDELKRRCQEPHKVLRDLGPDIQWLHSYVTDDKFYCIFQAPSEDLIRLHARKAGIPADRVTEIRNRLDHTSLA